ncbi:histidine kinase [Bacteroidota bacterium]
MSYDIDSMLVVLQSQGNEERINTLNKIAWSYCFYDKYKISQQYAEDAMTQAIELNYKEGIAAAHRNFGILNLYQSNYSEALNNFFASLHLYEELDNKHTVADIYYDIACTHYFANNDEKTVEYGLISLKKFREPLEGGKTVGALRDSLKVLGGLYLTYWRLGLYPEKRFEIILKIYKLEAENNIDIIGLVFYTIEVGANYLEIGEIDSAQAYFDKALMYKETDINIKALTNRAFTWKGYLYRSLDEYDSALYYHEAAYNWYNKTGALYWAMDLAFDVGFDYQKLNNLNKAERYYKHAEKIFNEIVQKNSWYKHDSLKNIVFWGLELFLPIPPIHKKKMTWSRGQWIYYRLYKINEEKNNTGEALKYYIAYSNAKDTLNRLLRNHETFELQTKYETKQKENLIDLLSQDNAFQEYKLNQFKYFLLGLVMLVILIVILAIVIIRLNKFRDRQNSLLLQQKLFRSQMNPHFLFNSLVSIQNFILEEEPARAGKYLSKFSKLVRNILDSSFEEYVPLEEEISTIENYFELQKVRFENTFDYSIEVDKAIDPENIYIPPMLLQPFIENSIEHGFKNRDTMGNIQVCFTLEDDMMLVELEDDGIGREKSQELLFKENKHHKSKATSITRDRIKVLNKKNKKKILLDIQDLKNENNDPIGTKVIFKIPAIFN